ncbi:hypothetical protein [Pyruvatibacter mobilis]|uniref:hypothetical protein n=1 Tax=Pyruvatibacter mobilis TaxID=1712261 RepID=UPI003BAB0DE6
MIQIELKDINGDEVRVTEAYEHNDFFAVHIGTGGWVLTHIPTGCSAGPATRTKREAKERAEKLMETGVDWSLDDWAMLREDRHWMVAVSVARGEGEDA